MIHDSKERQELILGQVAHSRLLSDIAFDCSVHSDRRSIPLKPQHRRNYFGFAPSGVRILTLLSGVTHNLYAYPKLSSFFTADTNSPDSQRGVVSGHRHHNRKPARPDFSLRA